MFVVTARLPPLLLAPHLQDVALVPVRARARRAERRAEGRAVVGRAPPQAPQALRHARATSTRRAARLLVLARRLDPAPRLERDRPDAWSATSRSTRSCAVLNRTCCHAAAGRAGARRSCSSAACRARVGLLRLDGAAVARHVHDQLARRTCSAAAATRPTTTRATTWLLALITMGEGWHNNHHHYQSSAQPGLPLVGDRRDVLRAARCSRLSVSSGTCAAAARP